MTRQSMILWLLIAFLLIVLGLVYPVRAANGPGQSIYMEEKMSTMKFDRVWYWNPNRSSCLDRKGQVCRILARGAMNSQLVEFRDGFRAVVSRNATRKIRAAHSAFLQPPS